MTTTSVLEVDRTSTATTRIVENDLGALADGQVRLRVDRLAITANTVTYAQFGDMLGYWDFFPTTDTTWGRVPAMGWADVVASAHDGVEVGGRYYGWFPMAQFVDVTVGTTRDGLRDDSPHRAAHAAVYRSFVDTRHDPMYPTGVTDPIELDELEDRHVLLRGLFRTAFLADAFFAVNDWFGADTAVVLSASSKTAIGFAHCAADRSLDRIIGVTSESNVDFVSGLGVYSDVVTYDEVDALDVSNAVAIDMAGNAPALAALHQRFADHLGYSMTVGRTHIDAPPAAIDVGPTPELFFAPNAMDAMTQAGHDATKLTTEMDVALGVFIEQSREWLTVQRTAGPDAAEATWSEVHAGEVSPDVGRVASLHS